MGICHGCMPCQHSVSGTPVRRGSAAGGRLQGEVAPKRPREPPPLRDRSSPGQPSHVLRQLAVAPPPGAVSGTGGAAGSSRSSISMRNQQCAPHAPGVPSSTMQQAAQERGVRSRPQRRLPSHATFRKTVPSESATVAQPSAPSSFAFSFILLAPDFPSFFSHVITSTNSPSFSFRDGSRPFSSSKPSVRSTPLTTWKTSPPSSRNLVPWFPAIET
mmetsp:Transcript_108285/g.306192  ORF Transcript_108285/g.306192 Transcript_108285/m.306192 type:complete len:216 (+) Transcript_108285:225-872(+)